MIKIDYLLVQDVVAKLSRPSYISYGTAEKPTLYIKIFINYNRPPALPLAIKVSEGYKCGILIFDGRLVRLGMRLVTVDYISLSWPRPLLMLAEQGQRESRLAVSALTNQPFYCIYRCLDG